MNMLGQKYRDDSLSAEELQLLKDEINTLSDTEIEQQIRPAWMEEEIHTSTVGNERMIRLKAAIDSIIGKKPAGQTPLLHRIQMAAAVLLPVFILLSFYLYRENSRMLSHEIQISTQSGERADIQLPDGTKVSLNSDSRLSYHPKSFHKDERRLTFEGEGYFQVSRADGIPFLVNAKGLQIKVLGTAFNLQAREKYHTAEVALEEGSLLLISTQSCREVVLQANQKAILDHRTGNIRVTTEYDIREHSAWRRGDMVFRNTELPVVLKKIEINYGVAVQTDCTNYLNECFTGTLPVDNLNEALEVLEKSFHLHATAVDKQVHLLCR
ncbi:MAG: FecR domain-containing protein [Tannerellaceae bacterium]|nr:FecR domain-containing protein [Tannerellaceae bacterium]